MINVFPATPKKLISQMINHDRAAILIIGLGFLLRILLLWSPDGNWRPADTASIAHFFLVNGFRILYPQVYWGGNGPGYVETEFQFYPFVVSLLYSVFGEHVWLGRFVSFLFSSATIITFYLLVKEVLNPPEALWALILFSFSPILLNYSAAFWPESTMMFFYIGGLYFFIKWLHTPRSLFLLLASFSTSMAILVKPSAIHIGLLFALLALFRFGYSPLLRDWKIWLAIVLCLFPVLLYYMHAHKLFLNYGNTFGVLLDGDTKFGNFHYWLSPRFYFNLVRIDVEWILGPTGIFVFLIGLYQSLKSRSYLLLLSLMTIALYYLIIARYSGGDQGTQYHIFMAPYAAIGFGIGLDSLLNYEDRQIGNVLAWISIGGVVLWSAILYLGIFQNRGLSKYTLCASQVQRIVPADNLIIVSSNEPSVDQQGIPINYQEPTIFFYSQRRGWSLPADWVNPEKFEELRQKGAKYYVILDRDLHLLTENPKLLNYMGANFNQVNSGIKSTCRIYQIR